jgi:hypothetical protein
MTRSEHWPKLVKCYLDKGYKLTHRGLICWYLSPSDFTTGKVRLRMIALKATLSYTFGACPETYVDSIWDNL